MMTGLPELQLPVTEPLKVAAINFTHGEAPVRVDAYFKDVVAVGLSDFQTDSIDVNAEDS